MSRPAAIHPELAVPLSALAALYPEGQAASGENAGDIPGAIPVDKGSYALLLWLAQPVPIVRGKLAGALGPGVYLYSGSARGPGGLRARLGRHLRADKARRWHIDDLTMRASAMAALAIPGGAECEIIARLLVTGAYETAMPGFGSSDCQRCAAHLLRYGAGGV